MKILRLDEIEGIPVFGTLSWKPVRQPLGVTAFGINAYTAANAGDEVVEEHTEEQLGHEEIYFVHTGHAVFTVDGEEVDAPAGTMVYLDDVKQTRHAIAKEAGTTVIAIGGVPGKHEPSAWEYFFPALPGDARRRLRHRPPHPRGRAEGEGRAGHALPARVRRGARRQPQTGRSTSSRSRSTANERYRAARADRRRLRVDPRRSALSRLATVDRPDREPGSGTPCARRAGTGSASGRATRSTAP